MKPGKHSFIEQAHLYIMASTLIVAMFGWYLYLTPAKSKAPHDWFGNVPMSIQPVPEIEHNAMLDADYSSTLAML